MNISAIGNTSFRGNITNCCGYLELIDRKTGKVVTSKKDVEGAAEEIDRLFGAKNVGKNFWLFDREGCPAISGAFEINPNCIGKITYDRFILKPTENFEAHVLYNNENNPVKSVWALNAYNTALNNEADVQLDYFPNILK